MFVVPSTLQVLLAVVLVLLGLCGNLVVPFVSYRTTLKGPHITVLSALDFTATLLGPGLTLVTLVIGPTWLEHNKPLCLSLSFLSSSLLITCVLVLFARAVFCQKVKNNIYPDRRRRARRRQFVFLAMCLLSGLLMCAPPLLGWSSYNGLSFLHSCSLLDHVQTLSNYSILYLVSSFFISLLAFLLAVIAVKAKNLYPINLFWDIHKHESRLNDPEITTENLSSSQPSTIRSFRSRLSSVVSGIRSAVNSPMASRKSSLHSRPLDSLVRSVLTSAQAHILSSASTVPQVSGTLSVPLGDAFVTPTSVPWKPPMLIGQGVFKDPRFLPRRLTAPQQQRPLLRLVLLRCFVTLLCWLPLYIKVVLHLSSVHYPQELQLLIQWLIFIQSSICSLLPLCDASYRRELKRAAHYVFNSCARRDKTTDDLSKSHDVRFRIEGNEQVRLQHLVMLGVEGLNTV